MATPTLTEVDFTRIASEASEQFTEEYYSALDGARDTLVNYYVPSQSQPTGRTMPHISYNGDSVEDPMTFQQAYVNEMPWTHFEIQSLNAHIVNPKLSPTEGKTKKELERNVSISVQVSGSVRLHERASGPVKSFSDSFVLVPNKEELGAKGTGKQDHGKRWLIQSQTFRFVS
ncbi:hypothetical protein K431DRAFT_280985 [Polychaeton citri CBS 116435]|uniref:NTF2 domain-containing protein n=1 Tax=Polychaeton citri CBS 116435 TaxID=1314669 RepID=A0A9P4UUZ0_9PEZI|nr:hypothetical protein K431DRAFT_280985 [Polychaeton citri CBS 116435]